MPLMTFNPPIAPSPGTRHSPKADVLAAEFGDGYTQSAPNGLNHIKQAIVLRWEGLTDDQYQIIRDFFENHGGYLAFYYQPRDRSTPLKWTCKEWSGLDSSPWSFEAKLEQSFTNEV
jgi:phage-related protein